MNRHCAAMEGRKHDN